jgi:hypothetical protein
MVLDPFKENMGLPELSVRPQNLTATLRGSACNYREGKRGESKSEGSVRVAKTEKHHRYGHVTRYI